MMGMIQAVSAREENYKGDDASSAVEHKSSSEDVPSQDDHQGGTRKSNAEEQSDHEEKDEVEQGNKMSGSESVDSAQKNPKSNDEDTEKHGEKLPMDSAPNTNQQAPGGSPDSDESKKSSEEQQESATSMEVNTKNLGSAPQNDTDLSDAALIQNVGDNVDRKGDESTTKVSQRTSSRKLIWG